MKRMLHILAAACLLTACEQDLPEAAPFVPEADDGSFTTLNYSGAYDTFFKPQVGWVGDVMPFYDERDGRFHIFYLADWRTSGGIHPIWHTSTADFGSWGEIRSAIENGTSGEQDVTIGTGSFIQGPDGRYYGFYTGERSASEYPRQAVMLATSDDLVAWRKEPSFGVLSASPDYDVNEFRDPQVFRNDADGLYHLAVTSYFQGRPALAHYTSSDLKSWTLQPQPLYVTDDTFMECPDLFRMGDKWYLLYSRIDAPRCVVCTWNDDLYDLDGWSEPQPLDGYNYYAAKTAADSSGNRYLAGWCQTFEGSYDSSGWGGSLVAHRLTQQADGSLAVSVPEGVAGKYASEYPVSLGAVSGGAAAASDGFTLPDGAEVLYPRMGSHLSLSADFTASGRFGIAFGVAGDSEALYTLLFEPDGTLLYLKRSAEESVELNRTTVSASASHHVELYIEHSVCVCYIDGTRAFTCRIYQMEQNAWKLFSEGGSTTVSRLQLRTC